MKVIAACLLAVLGGKTNPTGEDIKGILASVGIEAEEYKIELLISQIKGKDIAELIAVGKEMLGSVSGGGGCAVAASAPSGGDATAGDAVSGDQNKVEKVEAKEESDEEDFNFNLFD